MISKGLFIFDVDGTLVNSYPAIARSLNFTRKKLGLSEVSFTKVKRSIGRGDESFIETFFAKAKVASALKIYRQHHQTALVRYSRLRPQARSLLSSLKRKNKQLAVASNRPARFTRILLNELKIAKYFDGVWCADQVKALKPDPKILNTVLRHFSRNKEEAVYIGDMAIDLETAQRAKVDAVFITGGSSSLAEVKKYHQKKVISELREILELYN